MKIGICIVHFGDDSVLQECKATLPDKSPFFVEIFDCNKENIGFSRGNNELIKKFLGGIDVPWDGSPPEWIWLLNNDTKVPKETLEAIQKLLPELPKEVGIVGFKILSMENPDLIHHAGTHQCVPAGVHKSGSVKLKQFTKRTNEKWVTFASVLIRREVFVDIGLLDPNMFNYYSDSDFCFRARYAGWKVIYEPNFVILHKIGSSQHPSESQIKMIMHDGFLFQNKWINGFQFHDLDKELV